MTPPTSDGILLVEDEEDLRRLFALLLQMEHFVVFQASDGEEGLDLLKQHRDQIRIVITDLNLPRLGGMQLITAIRSVSPSVKVIVTSGMSGDDVVTRTLEVGADAFIPKPFVPDEALATVKKTLGEA